MEQKQLMNVNEEEVKLIKAVFTNNDVLLQAMRAVLLGLSPTVDEQESVRSAFANEQLKKVIWRRFYPTLDKNSPIGQVQDVWLGVEEMVFGHAPDTIKQAVDYKRGALEMTRRGLNLCENPGSDSINVEYFPESDFDVLKTGLLARNQYIRHVESQLLWLKIIAGQKEETPQETKKRLSTDSGQ